MIQTQVSPGDRHNLRGSIPTKSDPKASTVVPTRKPRLPPGGGI